MLADGTETTVGAMNGGERIAEVGYPESGQHYAGLSEEQAELLGILASDGSVSKDGRDIKVTSASSAFRREIGEAWLALGGPGHSFDPSPSGVARDKIIGQVVLTGRPAWLRDIRLDDDELLPLGHRTKRVPWQILNAPPSVMHAFLRGYSRGDGLEANRCIYECKNFKTSSATLAAGLLFLIDKTTRQHPNITVEDSTARGQRTFHYSINLASDSRPGESAIAEKHPAVLGLVEQGISQRQTALLAGTRPLIRQVASGYIPTGHHSPRTSNEVKKVIDYDGYDGWFYDLETESGTFHAGVGRAWLHNSPRRGETFVSRKVTRAVARIRAGLQDELYLGNLDAQRDWGYAPEFVAAMVLMLQQDEPDDFVIATGEAHTVRDFVERAFARVGLDWEQHVKIDPRYYRPSEVDVLRGDASKAQRVLGWTPTTTFPALVDLMVDADITLLEDELAGRSVSVDRDG
jgi:GDPmannose 4,6-dehydratase